MRITTYKNLRQISFWAKWFPINCYFVEQEDSLLLIDTGLSFFTKEIVKAAAQFGKSVDTILLTHPHGDHVGGLDGLKEAFPNAHVGVSRQDASLLVWQGKRPPVVEGKPVKGGLPKKLVTQPDILLEEGDTVGCLQVVALPGHTPGLLGFYEPKNKFFVVGDALEMVHGLAPAGFGSALFPFIGMATWDTQKSLSSARKIAGYPLAQLAAGHGDMLANPTLLLEKAIYKAEDVQERKQHGKS